MNMGEKELRTLERAMPHREEKDATKIVRMLPHVADPLRKRGRGGNLGSRDLRSIIEGRKFLFGIFGGKVPLRPASAGRRSTFSDRPRWYQSRYFVGSRGGRRRLCQRTSIRRCQ
jgi:hypothetical protein